MKLFSKEKIIVVYAIERCTSCKFERKRKFVKGDCLFLKTSNCDSCKGILEIEKIFGEKIEG